MPKVLSTSVNADGGPHFDLLANAGFDVEAVDRSVDLFDEDTLINQMQGASAVSAGSEPYTARVIENLPDLRVISRSGVGFDAIDLAACDEKGVVVTVTPGVNHHAVAEHTIALLMGVARGFPERHDRVKDGRWFREPYPRVMGSTIGILGLGRIGRAVATRAVGLGMNVLAFEPFPQQEFVETWRVELVDDLNELIPRCDYLSLHLPNMAETHHVINAERLALMKPGSVLINTARGPLVDEAALIEALQNGPMRAAGLDVFEVEPLPTDSPLLSLQNVLLSGHVAGLDNESHEGTFEMVADTIIKLHSGEWPADRIVNMKGVGDWAW
ncbi:MAG TPA: 3-phosphoglycerate dehydrogenase [Planctomycetaceae bacterium]|nr:3-phosphoglycerate dehydrogenase [Planctomycetaceae bacterium]HCK54952.1 3-phosphoglycerate dehydrogenase [Planctomycetaceae bacterium]|tara:strand:+ start:530 stop:1513 length:984 start_codon:yes stop_codon:yes gene_type:complete